MKMPEQLRVLQERIDARVFRERVLLFATAALVVVMLWDFTVRAPVSQRVELADGRLASLQQQTEAIQQTMGSLRRELAELEDDGHERQVERARTRLAEIDERLAERTLLVISPTEMVSVLRDMLEQDRRLTLLNLRNHEVEAIVTETRSGNGEANLPRVYRHRVDVVVRGEYFALLDYMKRLEGLDWQFQWDDLRIETENYPRARATISISTLSLAEDWIGV